MHFVLASHWEKNKETVLGVRTCILDHPSPKDESSQHGTVSLGRC